MDLKPPKIKPTLAWAIKKILEKPTRPPRPHQGPFSLANIDNTNLYQQHYIDMQQPFNLVSGNIKISYNNTSIEMPNTSGLIHKASSKIDWATQENLEQAVQDSSTQPPEN
jgi:hypothetical protein